MTNELTVVTGSVSGSVIAAMCVTLFISMVLPVVLLLVYALKNRKQGVAKAWFLGAAGFFITQMVIRVPLLSMLSMSQGFMAFAENHYLLYAIALAFTAGLFELAGRYAVAKILSKNLTYKQSIAAGLGHGGIEAIALIGMTYVSNLLYVAMINTGAINGVIAQTEAMGVDVTAVYTLVDTLINTPAHMYLLAGYERILTMIAHTAMSLIVCYFVWKKEDVKGLVICLVAHTLLDGVTGIISGLATPYLGSVISQNVSYVLVYAFLTVVAVASVIVIRKVKEVFR